MMNRQLEAMTDRFALFQIRPKPTKIKASVERKLHDSMFRLADEEKVPVR